LMDLVRHGKLDLVPLLTHTYSLDRITEAYKLFAERRDGVIKVRDPSLGRSSCMARQNSPRLGKMKKSGLLKFNLETSCNHHQTHLLNYRGI